MLLLILKITDKAHAPMFFPNVHDRISLDFVAAYVGVYGADLTKKFMLIRIVTNRVV